MMLKNIKISVLTLNFFNSARKTWRKMKQKNGYWWIFKIVIKTLKYCLLKTKNIIFIYRKQSLTFQ